MSRTAILKSALSGETVFVTSAKGRYREGRSTVVVDVWIDSNKQPVCLVGKERPNWLPVTVNSQAVVSNDDKRPEYPIGTLCQ